jgi:hypothetical protein
LHEQFRAVHFFFQLSKNPIRKFVIDLIVLNAPQQSKPQVSEGCVVAELTMSAPDWPVAWTLDWGLHARYLNIIAILVKMKKLLPPSPVLCAYDLRRFESSNLFYKAASIIIDPPFVKNQSGASIQRQFVSLLIFGRLSVERKKGANKSENTFGISVAHKLRLSRRTDDTG